MLIVGAGGLAKEVLEIFHQQNKLDNIFFYDDITINAPVKLYNRFIILRNIEQVIELFKTDKRFIIAVGIPSLRYKLYNRFIEVGGEYVSAFSPFAQIGHYGTLLAEGIIVMAGSIITNDVNIGCGCLINSNCTISHDTSIGKFVDISPGVQITGKCNIGEFCNIGTNVTILPRINVGDSVIVGAGAVVTKNVDEGLTVIGIPAARTKSKNDDIQ